MVPAPDAVAIQRGQAEVAEVNAVLDAMHAAASRADGATYFPQFSPSARFIGTDAGEHWSLEAFRAYAEPYFARGQGWTYRPHDRTIMSVGGVFFFDEKLSNDGYGELRGSGVLARDSAGQLKIEQYVLSFTVPNDKADAVVAAIKATD
ncbi:MAG: protein with SnoaL 3 domain, NTF 2 superfamily [Brevundimonas sp.]|nr:MAG: protein with SnoaL 3 domain, NTF 2 superfamily [Brevundimonas sp.]